MGAIIKLVIFLVGIAGLGFTGLDTAQDHFGVDAAGLLNKMGDTPGGMANCMLGLVGGGLDQIGGLLASAQGVEIDPDNPGLVQSWGPEGIAAAFSALLVMFSTRS